MNQAAGLSPEELAQAPWCAAPDPHPHRPAFVPPPGATDCHAHVFGPISRYPYFGRRIYTPPDALPAAYWGMLGALGVTRAVLVQPSVYGSDNRAMLDAMAGEKRRMRGVAVVEETIADAELARMHELGVRGIRFNIVDVKPEEKGRLPIETVRRMADRVKQFGWHIQFLMHVDEFPELDRIFAGFPVDIVIDHYGYMATSKGIAHPGFQALLRLMKGGRCWVKFTGAYRISAESALPYSDVTPYARALVAAAPERIVWGTDWPHPKHEKPMPNDGDMASRLLDWIPGEKERRLALADNPAKLYGFD
jgi:predicted TIM-barrel fold metal-dependent hydrolase